MGEDEEAFLKHDINLYKSLNSTGVNKSFCCCRNGLQRAARRGRGWQTELGYFFISRIALPGPRCFALQMLQNCTGEF